ncbi:hypothetical protein B4065_1368 [Caldibacillus thermoamylovorans]|jgi:hypothetical protein|uniref:hypothetical protein n=1 Tax=Caldibacillus thermoamylovorans TaxID=35841 RepID=UPI0005A458EC|nr:hypothetical protein [Caldibacillus thermoamylovorans]KIO69702.1 hypothetical protein B4065_1368 [Caldibacillus thermoamylovorans]
MWYCEIEFVSGKNIKVIFRNKDEAKTFIDFVKYNNSGIVYADGKYINLINVEMLTVPKKINDNNSITNDI